MKAGVPWPRKKIKNIRRLILNLIRAKRQLGRLTQLKQLGVSSSQLDRLFGFWADGPSPGQWWAVRSSHEAMVCWVFGQGRRLSIEGLGSGLGL
ncbi:hypothetical protein F2Q68_00009000 [Brassica cretica]|uniref:Uncharacterized protein n=1 Tax=Brassica cretica TaxID=69181 RepID=A0A8S9L0E7_BRACR|nr:hypothetical protein F2Q68_00009000 [Brassica cretica]